MIELRMPSLGADMGAGALVEWVKRPGDPVKHGRVIAPIETQKGAVEIVVFNGGILREQIPAGMPDIGILLRGDGLCCVATVSTRWPFATWTSSPPRCTEGVAAGPPRSRHSRPSPKL